MVDHPAVSVPGGGFVGFCFFLLNHLCAASFCKGTCCAHMCANWRDQSRSGSLSGVGRCPECCCAPAEAFRVHWVLCRCVQQLAKPLPCLLGCSPSSPAPLCPAVLQNLGSQAEHRGVAQARNSQVRNSAEGTPLPQGLVVMACPNTLQYWLN